MRQASLNNKRTTCPHQESQKLALAHHNNWHLYNDTNPLTDLPIFLQLEFLCGKWDVRWWRRNGVEPIHDLLQWEIWEKILTVLKMLEPIFVFQKDATVVSLKCYMLFCLLPLHMPYRTGHNPGPLNQKSQAFLVQNCGNLRTIMSKYKKAKFCYKQGPSIT